METKLSTLVGDPGIRFGSVVGLEVVTFATADLVRLAAFALATVALAQVARNVLEREVRL